MTVALLSLGTELMRGELLNGNARWLAEAMSDDGLEVSEIVCVKDDRRRITETLARLAAGNTSIVCTGGLGPTTDDVTTMAVADLLGVPLVLDQRSLERIKHRFAKFGRTMEASNEKQAHFPEGAQVLDNLDGTAPGFRARIQEAEAFFLPGVPREMRLMFDHHVRARLRAPDSDYLHQVRLNTFGAREAAINDRLAGIESAFGVELGYRAHFPEIQVKVIARGTTEEQARERANTAAREVSERLGPELVFGSGTTTLAQAVGELLERHSLGLGLAESCTGGLVAELLTTHAGASNYFVGGIVCYSNQVKHEQLGVPQALLDQYGAVSEAVARAMVVGAQRALSAQVALAITGIAGPGGGTESKPVGLVHFAVARGGRVVHDQRVLPGDRSQIQRRAAFHGLSMLRKLLSEATD